MVYMCVRKSDSRVVQQTGTAISPPEEALMYEISREQPLFPHITVVVYTHDKDTDVITNTGVETEDTSELS